MKTLPRSKSACGIAYHDSGAQNGVTSRAGMPLVFLHGVGLCADVWHPQIEAFNSSYRVIAADLPGHGTSIRLTDDRPHIAHYSDRIAAFMQEVFTTPAAIVGHSLGALIGLDLATRYPELCQGIAALAPIFQRSPKAQLAVRQRADDLKRQQLASAADAPVKRWFGEAPTGHKRTLAHACHNWLSQVDHLGYAQAYSAFAQSNGPDEQALAALKLPSLFLSAERDQNSTPQMSQNLAARVAGAQAIVVSNARHMVPLTHPQAVNAALVDWLDRCAMVPASSQAVAAGGKR